MKKISLILSLAVTIMLGACCKEGLDGRATIDATIKHHDAFIKGATVYVKFDTKTQPASLGDYDAHFSGGAADSIVKISNLKCGDYYFYASGFDPAIGQAVQGGVPFTIRHADRKREQSIDIPVTE